MSNRVSTANIFGHPIHPMLIPFPIAFFVATFVCDMVFWQTGNHLWATAAAVYDKKSLSRLIRRWFASALRRQ